jgi:hypothetical protein
LTVLKDILVAWFILHQSMHLCVFCLLKAGGWRAIKFVIGDLLISECELKRRLFWAHSGRTELGRFYWSIEDGLL